MRNIAVRPAGSSSMPVPQPDLGPIVIPSAEDRACSSVKRSEEPSLQTRRRCSAAEFSVALLPGMTGAVAALNWRLRYGQMRPVEGRQQQHHDNGDNEQAPAKSGEIAGLQKAASVHDHARRVSEDGHVVE